MRSFLFFVLASYAVRCDDNYYVIEMPEELTVRADSRRPFKVYWNVPTMQCTSKKVPFTNLDRFGIIQNTGDSFRGDKIAILYDPGLFPALLKNETSGKYKFRNGGVPQEGDLDKHIDAFKDILETSVPDSDFDGVGIIDFESWRPVFRQNFGVLVPYKDVSLEIERKLHWWWPKDWLQAEAKRRFEEAARTFMQTTISIAKQMRPKAVWGYYGFPYCFNMATNNKVESCSDTVKGENDGISWLWAESTALYPSVYSSSSLSSAELGGLVRGRAREARRVRRPGSPLLPYFWFRYREGGFLSESDLDMAFKTLYKSGANGFIIWGSSKDVNTAEKCIQLRTYIETIMGPAIAKYASNDSRRENDVFYEDNHLNITKTDENVETNNKTGIVPDPEYHWVPPENYAQNIEQHVKELIKNNRYNNTTDENEATHNPKRNSLLHIVLNLIRNENQNITEMFEGSSENSSTKNDKRDVTTENYSTTDDNYSTESTSTTAQGTESTTGILSTTGQDFDGTTATTSIGSTTTEIDDLDTDVTTVESTISTTIESTTQTELTAFETSTEITTTMGYYTTDNNKETSKTILDVNITEFLLTNKLSKNDKKGMPSRNSKKNSTELQYDNDEVDDAKNNKKGLPKSTDSNEPTTSDAPFVHQVPGSTASANYPLVSMPILLVLFGLTEFKC